MFSKHLNCKLDETDLKLIEIALIEDLGLPYKDITTNILFAQKQNKCTAKIISKQAQPIVVCGLPIIQTLLNKINAVCTIQFHCADGDILPEGATLLTLEGGAEHLLMIERVLLNFLQHLSAVATITAKFVNAIHHTSTKILDTRKTLPGFRRLEKYAVYCGGGVNHRMGLYDAIMIKDTHIDLLDGLSSAIDTLPADILNSYPVIVEVRSMQELMIVLDKGLNKVTRVLLDNMTPNLLYDCVKKCKGIISTEASGNIHLGNIATVAECGVDFISVGQLTHSAGNVDLSMSCGS